MRKTIIDGAMRLLARSHALEPVVGVRFQIVALMEGRAFGLAGKRHRFGLHLSRGLTEDHIRRPSAAGLGEKEERPPSRERICRGTLLSRQQYLSEVNDHGYRDARELEVDGWDGDSVWPVKPWPRSEQ